MKQSVDTRINRIKKTSPEGSLFIANDSIAAKTMILPK